MSVIVNKTAPGAFKLGSLQSEINVDATIVPSCLAITASGQSLDIEMAAALDAGEDTALDAVIAAHVVPPEIIDTNTLPFSDLDDGFKLAVHPSYKPIIEDGTTYAVWAGCGDLVDPVTPANSVLGGGDLLHFDMKTDNPDEVNGVLTKDIRFDHGQFGRVWIHEAYLAFDGGGELDYVSSDIMATGAIVIDHTVSLDLVLDGDFVKPSLSGAGTGTHGFAAAPTLIARSFSMDGDWSWNAVDGLGPSAPGAGEYKISTVDTPVHRYVNKIPCYGTAPYFSMSSDETAEIWPGYYIRVNVHNDSNTTWHLSVIIEIYRERTVDP